MTINTRRKSWIRELWERIGHARQHEAGGKKLVEYLKKYQLVDNASTKFRFYVFEIHYSNSSKILCQGEPCCSRSEIFCYRQTSWYFYTGISIILTDLPAIFGGRPYPIAWWSLPGTPNPGTELPGAPTINTTLMHLHSL